MDPDIQDAQEIQGDIPVEIPDNHEEHAATDSYDELAKAEVADPPKRGRGRPLGAKNKKKKPEPEPEVEPEPEPEPEPAPEPSKSTSGRSPRQPKRSPSHMVPVLDVEFDEGYGGAGPPKKPVRIKKEAAVSLMEIIAQAANQQSERERGRRRTFYENYLPL